MSRYPRPERIEQAILNIADWRSRVQGQATPHLIYVLAMVERGVTANGWHSYEEEDDYDFFNRYFRVDDPRHPDKPYFDPLSRKRRIETHPHSNVATARKGTFARSWHAAFERTTAEDQHEWKFSEDFADKLRDRVLTKGGEVERPNALDFAVWFFRLEEFPNDATAETFRDRFHERFPLAPGVFDQLFIFKNEPTADLLQETQATLEQLRDIVTRTEQGASAISPPVSPVNPASPSIIADDDPAYQEVAGLLQLGTSGVILRGCPGTGKSWLAWQIALKLTDGHKERIERVQFHSAFGYEDFVEGYRPKDTATSGFEVVEKLFLEFAKRAKASGELHVMVIDEINRGDPSRIFGEVLTYIEDGWREIEFRTPFRNEIVSIPKNLLILATMNPHDRSVTPLDMAMLRRFDHVDVDPSSVQVEAFLQDAGFPEDGKIHIVEWFDSLQKMIPFGLGHAYFRKVDSINTLRKVYRYRIEPYARILLELEQDRFEGLKASFAALEQRLLTTSLNTSVSQ